MSNPNLPSSPDINPDRPNITGREAMIAAIGLIAFRIERGPNSHTPEEIEEIADTTSEDQAGPLS